MGDTVATATSQERRERLLAEFQAWWKEHLATSDKTAAKQRAIGEAKDLLAEKAKVWRSSTAEYRYQRDFWDAVDALLKAEAL